MTVADLIEQLQGLDQSLEVRLQVTGDDDDCFVGDLASVDVETVDHGPVYAVVLSD